MKRFMASLATSSTTALQASRKFNIHVLGRDAQATGVLSSSLLAKDFGAKFNVTSSLPLDSIPSDTTFSAPAYTSLLSTATLGRNMLYSPLLPSTQTLVNQIANEVPPGTVCVADRQTAGKGRGCNVWYSPPGCLLFTFTFTTTDGKNLPFAQYLLSLALVQAIQRLDEGSSAVKIKWPNDIYAKVARHGNKGKVEVDEAGDGDDGDGDDGDGDGDGDDDGSTLQSGAIGEKTTSSTLDASSFVAPPMHDHQYTKIGGVLCQSTYDYTSKKFLVVAGIGLNVENEAPTTCLKSLFPSHVVVNRENVLAHFFNVLEPMLQHFNDTGFQHYYNDYVSEWLVSCERCIILVYSPFAVVIYSYCC